MGWGFESEAVRNKGIYVLIKLPPEVEVREFTYDCSLAGADQD